MIAMVLDLCQHLVQAKPLTLVDISPAELPPVLADYYENERRRVIAKLRDLDRLLGREQTIPERVR